MSRRTALALLLLIVVFGVGLRSYQLTARSLWFDEAFSWRLINVSFSEMIERAAADVHPPLYYVVLRGWAYVFGSSLLALRSFSVLGAAATMTAAYLFTSSAWRSRATGLLVATLVASSGWQIAFAWEARMYTLGTFFALLSSWLLLRALGRMKVGYWLAYGIVTGAFAYIHYFAFFTIAAHLLLVGILIIRQTRWRLVEIVQARLFWYALAAAALMTVLYLPWLPTLFAQNSQVQAQYWVPAIGGWSIPDTFYRMFLPTSGIPSHTGLGVVTTSLPLVLTIVSWLLLLRSRRHREATWLVVFAGMLPFVLSVLVSSVGQSLYQDRFLVFAHIFMLVGLAVLVMRISVLFLRRLAAVALVVAFLGAHILFWQELDITSKPGAHGAASLVFTQRQADEPVLVSSPFVFFAVDHYAREEFAGATVPRLYASSDRFVHFAGGPILTVEDLISPQMLEASSYPAIWMVDTSGFGSSEATLPPSWQRQRRVVFPEVFSHQGEVFVSRYVRNSQERVVD
jgi:mannosyltransferase